MIQQFKVFQSITPRSEQSLEKYLTDISRVPMISTDEEVLLAQAIHAGGKKGEAAKNKLVTANLRFVISVAKQFQHQGVPLGDLINEGNIGLMKAAEKFDETRGFKFISYAIWWIRQSILQAVADQSKMVRKPISQIAISSKIKKATNAFIQKNQRQPSAEELGDILSMEIGKIEKALQSETYVKSIDEPLSDEDDNTIESTLGSMEYAADREVNQDSMRTDIMNVLYTVLNDRERTIVIQSFGLGCKERALEDIGEDLGLTRERVRQIRERGLDKMRKNDKTKSLLRHLC